MAIILLIFTLLFVDHLFKSDAQVTYVGCGCEGNSNKSMASLYERNQFFLSNISSQSSTTKFYNVTIGDTPNKVYILYQCQEDRSLINCMACIDDAIRKIIQVCSLCEEAIVWYVECMLRFAYHNIFSSNKTNPYYVLYNTGVSNDVNFDRVVAKTMNGVITSAVKGSNGSHFATIETNLTSSEELYSFAQCTPDLDGFQCQSCLKNAFARITQYCKTNFLITIFYPSCQLGYEKKRILVGGESLASSPESSSDEGNKGTSMPTIIIAITFVGSLGLVFLVAGLWLCLCREMPEELFEQMSKPTTTSAHVGGGTVEGVSSLDLLQFDYACIKAATSNFSWKNKLGQGGFGEVFKGVFANGEEIAVKRLSGNSKQGASEFKNEVLLLAKLQHKNLVKLLGFCMFREEKILIFEFLSNLSLDRFLFDPLKRASLEWEQRFKIIIGVARGLLYLHEDSRLKIIHRDLKASNILLDEAMNAKIADFGLAKLFDSDQTRDITTVIAGTYGYMAPEYVLGGQFSVKSDVYSFGVIVLEIVSGQKNRFRPREEEEGLLHRAWRLWKEGTLLELVDPMLRHTFSEEQVKLCIHIGLLCIQEDSSLRPRIASIVSALNGKSISLPSPNTPHFFKFGATSDGTSSNNCDIQPENEFRNRKSYYNNGEHSGTKYITELCPR